MKMHALSIPLLAGLLADPCLAQEKDPTDLFAAKWPRLAAWIDTTTESDPGCGVVVVDGDGRRWGRGRGINASGRLITPEHSVSIGTWSRELWAPALRLIGGEDGSDANTDGWSMRTLGDLCGLEALESVGMECLESTTLGDLAENRVRFVAGFGGRVASPDERRPMAEVLRANVQPVDRWNTSDEPTGVGDGSVGAIIQWVVESRSGRDYASFLRERLAPTLGKGLRFDEADEDSDVVGWRLASEARTRGEVWAGPDIPEVVAADGLTVPILNLTSLIGAVELQNSGVYETPSGDLPVLASWNYAGVVIGQVGEVRFAFVGSDKVTDSQPEGIDLLVADLFDTDSIERAGEDAFGGGWNSAVGLAGGAGNRKTAYGPARNKPVHFWPGVFDVRGPTASLGSTLRVEFDQNPASVVLDGQRIVCETNWPRGFGLSASMWFDRDGTRYALEFHPHVLEQGAFLTAQKRVGRYFDYRTYRVQLTETSGRGLDLDGFKRVSKRVKARMEALAAEPKGRAAGGGAPAQVVGFRIGGESKLFVQGSVDGAGKEPVTEDTVLPFGGLTRALTQRLGELSGLGMGAWIREMNGALPARYSDLDAHHGGEMLPYLVPFDRRLAPGAQQRSVEQILEAHLWPAWKTRLGLDGTDLGCAIHQRICERNGKLEAGASTALAREAQTVLQGTFRSLDEAPEAESFRFREADGRFVPRARREVEFAGGVCGTPSDLLSLAVGLGESVDVGNEVRFFGGNWSDDVLGEQMGVRRVEYRDSGSAWTARIVDYPTLGLSWFVFLAHSDEEFADELEQELVTSALGDWNYDLQVDGGVFRGGRAGVPWKIQGALDFEGEKRAVRVDADFGESSEVVVRVGAEVYRLRGRALGSYRFEAESAEGVMPRIRVEGQRALFQRSHDVVIYIDRDGFGALPYGGVLLAVPK